MSVRRCKAVKTAGYSLAQPIDPGTLIQDSLKRRWIAGSAIGQGGFGRIYSAKLEGEKLFRYVIKIEPQENGPLFTEMHFYMRACSEDSINSWKVKHALKYLGIPRYISSGSINLNKAALRFLVMDRFSGDLETTLKNHEISISGILEACANVLNALEYMHSRDYVHADIKASNLLHRTSQEEVYLADFGLVHLFRSKGVHTAEKADPKFRHNGTIEFCSRDAHNGLPPSRRGDLEILVYNLIHWLARSHTNAPQSHSTGLPWGHLISDPKLRANVPDRVKVAVAALKEKTMKNPAEFVLQAGYGSNPDILAFIQSITKLNYTDTPDYSRLRQLLYNAKCSLSNKQSAVVPSYKLTMESDETSIKASPSRRKCNMDNSSKINDSRALNSVENLEVIHTIPKTPGSLPGKRPRGRPPGRPKQLENISPAVTSSSSEVVDSSKHSKVSESGAKPNSKRTNVKTLNSQSICLNSPTETSTPDGGGLISTVSGTRFLSPSSTSNKHSNSVLQQRVRTRLIDLFSDSDDESFVSQHNLSKSRKDALKLTPKLQSPKQSSPFAKQSRQKRQPLTSSTSKLKSPEFTSLTADRRRSGWCQTSPELLAVAKAEALGRKALKLAEMNYN
ncbi:unnamed protein product [Schistosoma rodhaini]|uniref:Protein kinase domain-containing protein n=1 Tax=Schistosoma rodhaini TaxID=6188 RepID=A0AA85F989_9TREM|nr:unnamed protein product [Schistosoma rodhaini]